MFNRKYIHLQSGSIFQPAMLDDPGVYISFNNQQKNITSLDACSQHPRQRHKNHRPPRQVQGAKAVRRAVELRPEFVQVVSPWKRGSPLSAYEALLFYIKTKLESSNLRLLFFFTLKFGF